MVTVNAPLFEHIRKCETTLASPIATFEIHFESRTIYKFISILLRSPNFSFKIPYPSRCSLFPKSSYFETPVESSIALPIHLGGLQNTFAARPYVAYFSLP
jgi:hypothetical protein